MSSKNNDSAGKSVSVRLSKEHIDILNKKELGGVSEGIRRLIEMYDKGNLRIELSTDNKYSIRENDLIKAEKIINDLEGSPSLKNAYKDQIAVLKKDLLKARKQFEDDAQKDLIQLTNILNFKKQA
jgi:hypothetical protein